jgi:hypothetical protein
MLGFGRRVDNLQLVKALIVEKRLTIEAEWKHLHKDESHRRATIKASRIEPSDEDTSI